MTKKVSPKKKRRPVILGEEKPRGPRILGEELNVSRVVLSEKMTGLLPVLRERQERLRKMNKEDQIYLTGRIEKDRIVVEDVGLMPVKDLEEYAERNVFRAGKFVSEKGGLPKDTVGMLHSHVDRLTPEQVPEGAEKEFARTSGKAVPSEADVFHVTSAAAAREKQTRVILMFEPGTGKLVAWAAHPDGSVTRINKFTLRMKKHGKA